MTSRRLGIGAGHVGRHARRRVQPGPTCPPQAPAGLYPCVLPSRTIKAELRLGKLKRLKHPVHDRQDRRASSTKCRLRGPQSRISRAKRRGREIGVFGSSTSVPFHVRGEIPNVHLSTRIRPVIERIARDFIGRPRRPVSYAGRPSSVASLHRIPDASARALSASAPAILECESPPPNDLCGRTFPRIPHGV